MSSAEPDGNSSSGPRLREAPRAATWLPVAFLVTGLVMLFDYAFVGGAVRQLATLTYRPTEGQILSSAETTDPGGEAPATHGVSVAYSYAVDGRAYRGTRYSADDSFTTSGTWARDAVARLPAGARAPVYYAAGDPARAVLRRGLDGVDLVSVLLMFPFNVLAFGVCLGYVAARRAERRGERQGNLGATPAAHALVVMCGSPLLILAVVVLGLGSDPPISAMVVALTLPFVFGGVVYAIAKAKRRAAFELL